MRRPNETTPNRWRLGGECAGQEMEQHQISTAMECTGWTKRMRCGDEVRRPNEKTKARQWMHRPNKKRRRGAGMHRPNKERRPSDGMHRPKEKEVLENDEDDEFVLMEHHLRDEKKDLWKQEICEL
jgi:hypothetical protein